MSEFQLPDFNFKSMTISCDDDNSANPTYTAAVEVNHDFLREVFGLKSKRDVYREHLPKKVIFRGNVTICFWKDGTKTVSKARDNDRFDKATGVIICAIKKWMPGGSYWLDALGDLNDRGVVQEQFDERKFLW